MKRILNQNDIGKEVDGKFIFHHTIMDQNLQEYFQLLKLYPGKWRNPLKKNFGYSLEEINRELMALAFECHAKGVITGGRYREVMRMTMPKGGDKP